MKRYNALYPLYITLNLSSGKILVVLCLGDRSLVEVEWQITLTRFRAFYTMVRVRDWNGLRK
jgi:hypothetical protein